MRVEKVQHAGMLERAKWAFTTRRVDRGDVAGLDGAVERARAGDLVLAEIAEIGQHKTVQLACGRPSESYPGDLVVLACGDRYAPDQFEGVATVDPAGADLLAAGGLIGKVRQANEAVSRPTRLRPRGLLVDGAGRAINVAAYALPSRIGAVRPPAIAVVGTSMNAGKTTAVASLAHGLAAAGLRVAALKATGTGAFRDYNAYGDAGAAIVADFTDAGMASTYRQPVERIADGLDALLAHAGAGGAEVAVVELADGVLQQETAALLGSPRVRSRLDGVLFAAPDALGAVGGVATLRALGLEPVALSGLVSRSPLAAAEAFAATGVVVHGRQALRDGAVARALLDQATRRRGAAAVGRAA